MASLGAKRSLQSRNTYLTSWRFCQDNGIQQWGLSTQYKQNKSEEGKWLSHISGVVSLNPEEAGGCFFEDIAMMPNEEKYQHFADYLTENYMDCGVVFPPTRWASRSSSRQLTTKAWEISLTIKSTLPPFSP
jgi:hypothetical protein